jgi:hypothetical protein
MVYKLQVRGHFHWWSEKMFKQAMIAVAAFAAASTMSAPAEAHRDRVRASVVVSYGSPGYYDGHYDPYYQPVYYRPRYRSHHYYYEPRYRYRPRYYYDDRYYRPHRRHWKKRHWRRHHDRHW